MAFPAGKFFQNEASVFILTNSLRAARWPVQNHGPTPISMAIVWYAEVAITDHLYSSY